MVNLGKIAPKAPASPLFFAWIVFFAFAIVMVILLTGTYAKKEEVTGRVVLRNVVRVSAEQPGYVEQVLVQPGQSVYKDQPLARIRTAETDTYAETTGIAGSAGSISRIEQLVAISQADEAQMLKTDQTQQELLALQRKQLEQEQKLAAQARKSVQRRLEIARTQKDKHERLYRDGIVSELALQDAITRYESVLLELSNSESSLVAAQQRTLELAQRESDTAHNLSLRLSEIARERHELHERLNGLNKAREYVLFAPTAGSIDAATAFAGDRVEAGHPLFLIHTATPSANTPSILLDINAAAIGFAEPGTDVVLRLDAFPYERYGVIQGRIISSTSSTFLSAPVGKRQTDRDNGPTYLVEVTPAFEHPKTKIQPDWLKDGMTVSAALHLENLSLIEWLFLPVIKGVQRNPDYFTLTAARPRASATADDYHDRRY